jgi:hypothetical protein
VSGEHTPDCALIKRSPEYQVDLLSDSGRTESGIAPLHFNNGFDDFF